MASLKSVHDPLGTAVAAGFVFVGVFLAYDSQSMTAMGSVFPITVSAAMAILGLVLVVRNLVLGMRHHAEAASGSQEDVGVDGGSNMRRLLFVIAMIAWIALVPVLGFFVSSCLAYFAIMIVSVHERMGLKEGALLIVLGFVILGGFTLVMSKVLLIPMPRGMFF
ncbi:tripartite tricarboxylate transporter TctB family protein [Fulvimarina sp. MAC3]|uniref:tripartite tricarboxylate transporter TctB family protein n=1 Tax=Fulvimarina sp. MAC3 TaxID=3148887 RepID=UPI0031FCC10B